ncbi:PAS domain S-box protein [Chryseolinea sp. H1M3-3]|uniref:PAS domain-containing sensor histidine kinase n=1 Tax=Chryseolinea sp. H1M3-3 TaxID=3034144 RepID=UPI0023EDBCAA|nr:PAS domain S-box protein [Chryseolinea sp. H1M3-3]
MDRVPLSKKYGAEENMINTLAEAYRLQEAIISATELSVISTDTKGIITSFNRAAEDLLGYSAAEMIGKATLVMLHDSIELIERASKLSDELGIDVEPNFEALSFKAQLLRSADREEWTYIRKNGTKFPVMLSITGLWDDNGKLTGYAGIAADITEQRRLQNQFRKSEAHLSALVNSLDDIVFEVDEDGRFVNVWAKNDDDLFYPRSKILGRTFQEALGEEFSKPLEALRVKVMTTGQSDSYEYKSIIPGSNRWFNAKYAIVHENGKPTKRLTIRIEDITTRKVAESKLIKSEQKFRSLTENIPGVIYLRKNDEAYSMIYLNSRVEELTGFEASQFLSSKLNFSDLYHPNDQDRIRIEIEHAVAEKRNFSIEYRIRHKTDTWRFVKEDGMPVIQEDGSITIEGFIIDITAQKNAEKELLKVAKENYRLFNTSVNLNAISGFDGYFKKLSPAWEQLLGWTDQELKTNRFVEFVHHDDVPATEEMLKYISEGNDLHHFENRYRCKDGSYRWLLWSSATDVKNQLMYTSAIDITERKKSEDELLRSKQSLEAIAVKLQEQNRQLDEFAHIISHNLRSPVGNIKALISLLDANSSLLDYQQIFEKIKTVSSNLGETMNELMETLKVKTDTDIPRVEIRFKEVFDKVIQSLEGELIQQSASITFDFNDAPKIYYSKAYLESIFQNLLTNALKYASPKRKPEIKVTTSTVDTGIELRVQDNGLGIDMQRHGSKLFGLHKTFHVHQDAKGVGLFLVKTQVEALGGSISAESEVDQGTTFIIQF